MGHISTKLAVPNMNITLTLFSLDFNSDCQSVYQLREMVSFRVLFIWPNLGIYFGARLIVLHSSCFSPFTGKIVVINIHSSFLHLIRTPPNIFLLQSEVSCKRLRVVPAEIVHIMNNTSSTVKEAVSINWTMQ